MNSPPITIVIPVCQAAGTLAAAVRAIFEHTEYSDWQVIVVDDGAPAGEVAAAMPKQRNLRVIRQANGGLPRALNAGFAAAAGRDVVRLHADVVIETAGWLRLLVETAYAHPRCGVVGARLVYPDGRIQSEGRDLISGLGWQLRHCDRKSFLPETVGGQRAEVDAVPGALAYYRRDALDEIGGLDEGYGPTGFEDDDYCFAARRLGYKVWVEPAVRAVHYCRAAPPTFPPARSASERMLFQLIRGMKQTVSRLQAERWQVKWGWHPFYPDLNEVRRLYGETEICWRIGEALRFKPSQDYPSVDCCLVTWNSLAYLRRTLETLARVDYPADRIRVIVANNGSNDGTPEYLEQLARSYPFSLTTLNLPLNCGVAVGLNFAIQAGSGELVARLDDDIVLPTDWLKLMLGDLRQRPFAGAVGLKTLGDDDRRAIQWAAETRQPHVYSHADEPDAGQADLLTRVPYVAGCCVLYRRDAIRRCGLVDVRYGPTQVDDIDHSTALAHAGFEILCEGRSSVLHKRTSGLDRSAPGLANSTANWHKFFGKWGDDALAVLDHALLLSREGRCLPPDGDTSAWMDCGPSAGIFPRREATIEPESDQVIRRLYEARNAPTPSGSELHALADFYLASARTLEVEGDIRGAADAILVVINFAPTRLEAYQALAAVYSRLGQSSLGQTVARRGLNLFPHDSRLRQLADLGAEQVAVAEKAAIAAARQFIAPVHAASAGWTSGSTPRVLLVKAFQPRGFSDDLAYLTEYRDQLRLAGIHAEIQAVPQPDPRGCDVVHLWGGVRPHQTLAQLKAVRVLAPQLPIVLTPSFEDWAAARWNGLAINAVFARPTQQLWELGLNDFAAGKLAVSGEPRPERSRLALLGTEIGLLQRQLFQQADHLLPFTAAETGQIERLFGLNLRSTELPTGAGRPELSGASADPFVKQYRLRDFVLMTGPVEPSRNHLAALYALHGGNWPALIVGPQPDVSYLAACRKLAPRGSLFIESLSPEMMRSAYRAARIFLAPAWVEASSHDAVEAAFAGCSLALSDRLNECASFAGGAQFFDPDRHFAIRAAVQAAWSAHPARKADREAFAARLALRHDWSVVIPTAVAAYESLLVRA